MDEKTLKDKILKKLEDQTPGNLFKKGNIRIAYLFLGFGETIAKDKIKKIIMLLFDDRKILINGFSCVDIDEHNRRMLEDTFSVTFDVSLNSTKIFGDDL